MAAGFWTCFLLGTCATPKPTATPAAGSWACFISGSCLTHKATPAPRVVETPVMQTAIYSVSPSSVVVHNGDRIVGVVRTSTDIVSVTARVSILSRTLEQTAPGTFRLYVEIPPKVPFFLHRSWTLTVQARTARGVTIERSVPVTFS